VNYLSLCSGIEAKACTKCGEVKPLDDFHRHRRGPLGRHSHCKPCWYAGRGPRRIPPVEHRRRLNLRTRYRLTPEAVSEMAIVQGGVCAICGQPMKRPCIDHDHDTGRVRGLLCHGCNIKLPAVEDAAFMAAALRYLG